MSISLEQWLAWDPCESTKTALSALSSAEQKRALEGRLTFGTAGLRGKMAPGPAHMNVLTVLQAAQGLVAYLNAPGKTLVVGFDGRYQSRVFAHVTARAAVAKGMKVDLFRVVAATPLVPFRVLAVGAAAGVMVTASHNPAADNGFKVYSKDGCQIVSPMDKAIAEQIAANMAPWAAAEYGSLVLDGSEEEAAAFHERLYEHPLISDPTHEAKEAYKAAVANLTSRKKENAILSKQHPIVFTAMHGVGKHWVADSFDAFGLEPYVPVPEQIEPNPDFPTVAFPNPEEGAGALLLSFKAAERAKSRLVLANDPDSDRLAVAERIEPYGTLKALPETASDDAFIANWRVFTGNDIGILMANYCVEKLLAEEPNVDRSKVLLINTTVSSKMLSALARKHGLRYEEVLTGFKWIGSVAIRLIAEEGCRFLFGFEEAIGNMVGTICFDKDGVRGAAIFAEMALQLYDAGSSIAGQLEALGKDLGYYVQRNGYFFCHEPSTMASIFGRLRANGKYAKAAGAFAVADVRDLTTGYDSTQADKKAILPVSSSSHMITYYFENGAVCTLRGSGTEPKLKFYIEAVDPKGRKSAEELLKAMGDAIIEEFLQPEANGLQSS